MCVFLPQVKSGELPVLDARVRAIIQYTGTSAAHDSSVNNTQVLELLDNGNAGTFITIHLFKILHFSSSHTQKENKRFNKFPFYIPFGTQIPTLREAMAFTRATLAATLKEPVLIRWRYPSMLWTAEPTQSVPELPRLIPTVNYKFWSLYKCFRRLIYDF